MESLNTLKLFVMALIRDEEGAEMVEWTVLVALLVVGLAAIITLLNVELGNIFTAITNILQGAQAQ